MGPFGMALPRQGDIAVRTADGARFTVLERIEAGGEEVYRLQAADGSDSEGGSIEATGASFVKEHDQDRPEFEIVEETYAKG